MKNPKKQRNKKLIPSIDFRFEKWIENWRQYRRDHIRHCLGNVIQKNGVMLRLPFFTFWHTDEGYKVSSFANAFTELKRCMERGWFPSLVLELRKTQAWAKHLEELRANQELGNSEQAA